jgi:hypothetical protein
MIYNFKSRPNLGDIRVINRFAWFPKFLNGATGLFWLEGYIVTEEFQRYETLVPEHGPMMVEGWRATDIKLKRHQN